MCIKESIAKNKIMKKDFRDLQKAEAVHRLKLLNEQYKLLENVVTEFEEENIIFYSEYQSEIFPAILYWVSNCEELEKMIKEIETKNQILVYHAILTPTTHGAYFSVLYVSKYQDEWESDRNDLKEGLPLAYCINLSDPEMAEFGRNTNRRFCWWNPTISLKIFLKNRK